MKPEDISTQAEALILLAPPTQIFNQIEAIANNQPYFTSWSNYTPKNNRLWFYEDRRISFSNGKMSLSNNPSNMAKDAHGVLIAGNDQYYTGLYRGMIYCEYLTDENITVFGTTAQTIFDTRYVCDQNIGAQNTSLYKNPYFNTSMNTPTILYTVPATLNNGVEESDGKYLNKVFAWYYCPTRQLSIRANNATFTKMIGVAF